MEKGNEKRHELNIYANPPDDPTEIDLTDEDREAQQEWARILEELSTERDP